MPCKQYKYLCSIITKTTKIMLRKFFILLLLRMSVFSMYAQSVQRLETNPSFKGISIGMPIHSIADKLTYERSVNGFTLYKIMSANYCSVFNVRMDFVRVVAKDGKVHAIDAVRMVKATESCPTVFNADDLDVIKAGLTSQYGEPTHGLREDTNQYNRFGYQWQAQSKQVCCFMDFYGTFQGYKLQYSLSEFSLDY